MQPDQIIRELERNKEVFKSLLQNTPPELYNWRPKPDKWSILEILCHLHDEEIEDFRSRTNHVLTTPDVKMNTFDPRTWVTERNYAGQDFEQKLQALLAERQKSIHWLENLDKPKWDNVYVTSRGPRTADFYLANWLAHDFIHIRQINRNRYEYLEQIGGQLLDYAGNW